MANKKTLVQDQAREEQMISMLGLIKNESRMGHDAEDEHGHLFELKSTTKNNFATGRDVSIQMITKWKPRHWIFASGENYASGFKIKSMYYCSPQMMEKQLDSMIKKFKPDLQILELVVNNVKEILDPNQLKRLEYLLNRGMTYNNPHIRLTYVRDNGIKINLQDPKNSFKEIVQKYNL